MAESFEVKILTPSKALLETKATEVLLPSLEGECGVLAGHKDFIGVLATGVLKIVENGNDYWFMVSSGAFEVSNGALTVLADVGEDAKSVDIEEAREAARNLEGEVEGKSLDETKDARLELERAKARMEAYRRTELLN